MQNCTVLSGVHNMMEWIDNTREHTGKATLGKSILNLIKQTNGTENSESLKYKKFNSG